MVSSEVSATDLFFLNEMQRLFSFAQELVQGSKHWLKNNVEKNGEKLTKSFD